MADVKKVHVVLLARVSSRLETFSVRLLFDNRVRLCDRRTKSVSMSAARDCSHSAD